MTQNEWNHLHDVILEATWHTSKTDLNQGQLENLYNKLPDYIKLEAEQWSLNDTTIRDLIYNWYTLK